MMQRRQFLRGAASATVGVGLCGWPRELAAQMPRTPIGIQVGAVSFLDEGTDKVLDTFTELAAIDTLFLATFTYGRGIGGRQPRGNALPDHGRQEYGDNYHGGNFATPHSQFYKCRRADVRQRATGPFAQRVRRQSRPGTVAFNGRLLLPALPLSGKDGRHQRRKGEAGAGGCIRISRRRCRMSW
jgi:hypothetical protein